MKEHDVDGLVEKMPPTMSMIAVGGCANGVLLENVRSDADRIVLSRPSHIKPIEASYQQHPEIAHEQDTYNVYPMVAPSGPNSLGTFLIAVIDGQTLMWALSKLVTNHVRMTTADLVAAGVLNRGKKGVH